MPQPATAAATRPRRLQRPGAGHGARDAAAAAARHRIRSIAVSGNQRLEPETVLSYTKLRPGQPYTARGSIRRSGTSTPPNCSPTSTITGADTGNLVIQVRENPVINRIILEGNKRIKDDKITPGDQARAAADLHPLKARADVARIIELYRRQGRFAATRRAEDRPARAEPRRRGVRDQRGAEVQGPPDQHHRQREVRRRRACAARWRPSGRGLLELLRLATTATIRTGSPTTSRSCAQFYLTQGYADFRVVSAVAELTPDRRDFIITYVVEEGQRYKFGDVKVESDIRDFNARAARPPSCRCSRATGTTPSRSRTRSPR